MQDNNIYKYVINIVINYYYFFNNLSIQFKV